MRTHRPYISTQFEQYYLESFLQQRLLSKWLEPDIYDAKSAVTDFISTRADGSPQQADDALRALCKVANSSKAINLSFFLLLFL